MRKTIVTCDVCAATTELDVVWSPSQLAQMLRERGWAQRADAFRDVCPAHPEGQTGPAVLAAEETTHG